MHSLNKYMYDPDLMKSITLDEFWKMKVLNIFNSKLLVQNTLWTVKDWPP